MIHFKTKTIEEVNQINYDYIVVGGGLACSIFCKETLRLNPACHILIIEKGPYLIPDHVQNINKLLQPLIDNCAIKPWVSDNDLNFKGQIPYLGGRSLFWSGWTPQPRKEELTEWPQKIISELNWDSAKKILAIRKLSDTNKTFASFNEKIKQEIPEQLYKKEQDIDGLLSLGEKSNLRLFNKYSAVTSIAEMILDDRFNVDILLKTEIKSFFQKKGAVSSLYTEHCEIYVNNAKVILTCSSIETTTILLKSNIDNPLIGKNLIGHYHSHTAFRVQKNSDLNDFCAACILIPFTYLNNHYHIQVTAMQYINNNSYMDNIYHILPDVYGKNFLNIFNDDSYLYFFLHGIAEKYNDKQSNIYIDKFNNTKIRLETTQENVNLINEMERNMKILSESFMKNRFVEFLEFSKWVQSFKIFRENDLVHEAGTTKLGDNYDDSVTNYYGQIHNIDNIFILGPSLFPTCGSWNPGLMLSALALRLAKALNLKVE